MISEKFNPNYKDFDFWYYILEVNVIPADSKNKKTYEKWSQWQDDLILQETYEDWKRNNKFNDGCAVIAGKIHRGPYQGKYLVCIDIDNRKGIEEFLLHFRVDTLEKLAQKTIVEQHIDAKENKAHIYFIVEKPLTKRSGIYSNNGNQKDIIEIPAIEVKSEGSHGIMYCAPSIHKNGFPYQIIGTRVPTVLNKEQSEHLEKVINEIYTKYNTVVAKETGNKIPIQELFKPDFEVHEGNNRHGTLLRTMESLIQRLKNIYFEEEGIKELAKKWNQKHCKPPLDEKEFENQWKCAKGFIQEKEKQEVENDNNNNSINGYNHDDNKNQVQLLMEVAKENITLLFKDQFDDGYAQVIVNNDHHEIIPINNSSKFTRFLSKSYYEKYGEIVNRETINNIAYTLQAKAEFGDIKYDLSLRVTEYSGDIYYDLTDEKHRCIKISKKEGNWQILDKTPVPLFRRYNQISQDISSNTETQEGEKEESELSESTKDPLEEFLSKLTNIKDKETRLLVKVAIISYFVPKIPHIILILHGSAGSAKSTFQLLIKNIVDPAKPSLLTLHNNPTEFIQQLAQNYLATYDNMKYVPRWLPDEVCKAVTGVGQSKRVIYTVDDIKIYEYKHCLIFNGINIAFSEPDVLDRSIVIQLEGIDENKRRTEKEILDEFYLLRPSILRFIFDTLVKAIVIKDDIMKKIKNLPRMADFAIWSEAISQALGKREGEFLKAYFNNIGFQNNEVIDSNPVAFAMKRFVEELSSVSNTSTSVIFEGTPSQLLEELNRIAMDEKINTFLKEWPKDRKWLVKRINIIKTNLQKGLGIKIIVYRDSKNNTSIIRIEKNNSANSGEHKITPESEDLSPYFKSLSPENNSLSPKEIADLSIKSDNSGDSGDSGDKLDIIVENNDRSNHNSKCIECKTHLDSRIGHNHLFYYCKQHPDIQNIHLEEIERHIELSKIHGKKIKTEIGAGGGEQNG